MVSITVLTIGFLFFLSYIYLMTTPTPRKHCDRCGRELKERHYGNIYYWICPIHGIKETKVK